MKFTRRGFASGFVSRGTNISADKFTVSAIFRENLISGDTQAVETIRDATYENVTSATIDNEYDVVVVKDPNTGTVTLSSSNESVATVSQNGVVTRVSDGTVEIFGTNLRGRKAKTDQLSISRKVGQSTKAFTSWATGSLAKAATEAVDNAIAIGDVGDLLPMYTSGNARNPNCWAASLADLGCIDREKPSSTVIGYSNNYVFLYQVEHYPDNANTFVALDGSVYSLSSASAVNVGPPNSSDGYATDIRIVRHPMPAGMDSKITPSLLLPSDVEEYLPNIDIGVPVLATDQEKKALVADWYNHGSRNSMKTPTNARRLLFHENKIGGDSGSPAFILLPEVNGSYSHRLALVTAWTSGGAGSGSDPTDYMAEIQSAIESLGGNWADIEVADLTIFPSMIDGVWTLTEPLIADYDPSQNASLALWLDGSDQTTMSLVNGNEVDAWSNRKGGNLSYIYSAQSFATSFATTRPTVDSNGVVFDGVSNTLLGYDGSGLDGAKWLNIAKGSTTGSGAVFMALQSLSAVTGRTAIYGQHRNNFSNSFGTGFRVEFNNTLTFQNNSSNVGVNIQTTYSLIQNPIIIAFLFGPGGCSARGQRIHHSKHLNRP